MKLSSNMLVFAGLIILSFSTIAATVCPGDAYTIPYVLGNDVNCVTLTRSSIYFEEAEQKCSNRSGHLLTISNGYVNTLVAGRE